MRYVPPYGRESEGDSASYVNGDPTIGRQGSIPPAATFEHPMRELVGVIAKSGFTPIETDLLQLAQGVRSQRLNYAEDTGTANNLAVTYDPPIAAYTRGLTLRVRVRATNTGPSRINGGPGTVPIRKMNGADVSEGDLPLGAVATLVFDGTAFQLSNYGGGGGGPGDVFMVNIAYTVDLSTEPGIIRAEFSPPITAIGAGDIIAVRCANTAPGPTAMQINNLQPINLLPNGGGMMLQGDIAAGDVVQFFYDGSNLRFPPNAEINAAVTYSIGPGQQFETFNNAMEAIRRKTIGADGFVTLQFAIGVFPGPINISHPSADRIAVRGAMRGSAPLVGEFQRTGSTPQLRAQDAIFNLNMLRTRYGTEITIPDRPPGLEFLAGQRWNGIANLGAGRPLIADLLIVGQQRPNDVPSGWDQNGVGCFQGTALMARNVSVWGSQMGFSNAGSLHCEWCYACASTLDGFSDAGSFGWYRRCSSFGNNSTGFSAGFSSVWSDHSTAEMNGGNGWGCSNSAAFQLWWCRSLGNAGVDLTASVGSNMIVVTPALWNTSSPAINTVGNFNSIIVAMDSTDPGPPIGSPMPPTP